MNTRPDEPTWRSMLRSSRVKLAAWLALLMLVVCATLLQFLPSGPCFRGRSAGYWSRSLRASMGENGDGISYGGRQSWITRLSISFGIRHEDRDLLDLLDSDDPDRIPVLVELLKDDDPR